MLRARAPTPAKPGFHPRPSAQRSMQPQFRQSKLSFNKLTTRGSAQLLRIQAPQASLSLFAERRSPLFAVSPTIRAYSSRTMAPRASVRAEPPKVDKISSILSSMRDMMKKKKEEEDAKKTALDQLTINQAEEKRMQKEAEEAVARIEQERVRMAAEEKAQAEAEKEKTVTLPLTSSGKKLSNLMGVNVIDVLKMMIRLGEMPSSADDTIPYELADLIVAEFGFIAKNKKPTKKPDPSTFQKRPPVVCIMGHVDHGKTTLLDTIRNTQVAKGEAGGITQHISAFTVEMPSKSKITFLDTPGHEAFQSLRARGSQVTDIVVLVVAADDGVQPTTIEAIGIAQKSNIPIVVAINKMDKAGLDPEKIKTDLMKYGVMTESMGGNTLSVEISALKNKNIDRLEEAILFQADMNDLKVPYEGLAEGIVLDSRIDTNYGLVCVTLVQNGTLRTRDCFVAGSSWGRVRMLIDDRGRSVEEVPPSTPVMIVGSRELPKAGTKFVVVANERAARAVAQKNLLEQENKMSGEGLDSMLKQSEEHRDYYYQRRRGTVMGRYQSNIALTGYQKKQQLVSIIPPALRDHRQKLSIMLRADVVGSLEALDKLLGDLPQDEVFLEKVQAQMGVISEPDVERAKSSGAQIYTFNVEPNRKVIRFAEELNVSLKNYTVIYDLINDVVSTMEALLPPKEVIVYTGEALVQKIFPVTTKSKKTNVAGCMVQDGVISKKQRAKVFRNDEEIYDGPFETLRHFKSEVTEVKKGSECGINLVDYEEIQEGDIIKCYRTDFYKRKLGEKPQ